MRTPSVATRIKIGYAVLMLVALIVATSFAYWVGSLSGVKADNLQTDHVIQILLSAFSGLSLLTSLLIHILSRRERKKEKTP